MPPKRTEPKDLSHEEERNAREAFLARLRERKWESHEIKAAEWGWEYAFDVGFDRPEYDSDAAGDLAEGVIDEDRRKWGKNPKGRCADLVYDGIMAARKAQGL